MGEGGFHSSRSEVERRVRSSPSKNKFRCRRKFDRGLRNGGSKPPPYGFVHSFIIIRSRPANLDTGGLSPIRRCGSLLRASGMKQKSTNYRNLQFERRWRGRERSLCLRSRPANLDAGDLIAMRRCRNLLRASRAKRKKHRDCSRCFLSCAKGAGRTPNFRSRRST